MKSHFHLFVYGTLRREAAAASFLAACELVGPGVVEGTLYDIRGEFPALVLAGSGRVEGEIIRCPAALLPELDDYEGVADGLFRRVAVKIDGLACWTYVAGPTLARRLSGERRLEGGSWPNGDGSDF